MKTCTKCGQVKDSSEFYRSKVTRDGVQAWCIECLKQLSRERKNNPSYKRPLAESTELVRKLLQSRGIPSVPGTVMGQNYVDLMAWACVPIEAKVARESAPNKFIWTFSPHQLQKQTGLIVMVADYRNCQRVLVVPASHPLVQDKAQESTGSRSICLTPGSNHPLSHWPQFAHYEDRYDLIEDMRLAYVDNKDNQSRS